MALNSYANLQQAIIDWIDDSSVSSFTADFITLAESKIKSRVRLHSMLSRETAATSITSPYLALPAGFLEMEEFHFEEDPGWVIKQLPLEILNNHYTSTPGKPGYFSVVGNELKFNRITDAAYTVEMLFYKFSALSGTNTTNAVLTEYPSIYLEEAKRQAAIFVKDDDELQRSSLILDGDGIRLGLYDVVESTEKRKTFSKMKMFAIPRGRTP